MILAIVLLANHTNSLKSLTTFSNCKTKCSTTNSKTFKFGMQQKFNENVFCYSSYSENLL